MVGDRDSEDFSGFTVDGRAGIVLTGLMTTTRNLIAGKPVTSSERPAAWHALADSLLAEGWLYDATIHEWVYGDGTAYTDRGRIAWSADGTQAWLHHPGPAPTTDDLLNRRAVGTPDSHHTTA
jgi:hypothetical protein